MGGIGILLPYRRTHPLPHLEDRKAGQCEQAGMGALVSVIVSVVLWIIVFIFALAVGSATVY